MKVLIPTPLRPYAGGKAALELEASTAGAALQTLTSQHPDLRRHLYGEDGKLRRFVNVYVNDEDIRYLENENTPVNPGDTVSIIPSVAGGRGGSTQHSALSTQHSAVSNQHSDTQFRRVEGLLSHGAGPIPNG